MTRSRMPRGQGCYAQTGWSPTVGFELIRCRGTAELSGNGAAEVRGKKGSRLDR